MEMQEPNRINPPRMVGNLDNPTKATQVMVAHRRIPSRRRRK